MNTVKNSLTSKKWRAAAGSRAIRTMAQTAIGVIGSSILISSVDWKITLSSAIIAGLVSILTSIGGLPEVDIKESEE